MDSDSDKGLGTGARGDDGAPRAPGALRPPILAADRAELSEGRGWEWTARAGF